MRVDQPLVDVMTDKATVTIPSGLVGRVVRTHGSVGETVAVGAELVSFDTSRRRWRRRRQATRRPGDSGEFERERGGVFAAFDGVECGAAAGAAGGEPRRNRCMHSRRPARPCGGGRASCTSICSTCHGTGPNGRITHGDVDVHLRTEVSPSGPRRTIGSHTTEIQMVGMRRRIAEKMVVSNTQIPHFTYIEEVDITELEALREHLNGNRTDGQPKLTYLPFIMLAVTRALARFPQLNAHYDVKREVITRFEAVHLGVATQTDRGLCVPVVRHAETMDLWQAAREMRRITEAARNQSISRDELTDSTFTITSLGRHGGIAATPIINHPEVGILGINKAADRPVVQQGQIAIRRILHLSGSFDHRVVDGADGATFIQCVKDYLEFPATIFI